MLNALTTFEKLMQDHEIIQANTRIIACSADNLLAISCLQDISVDITNQQVNFISDRRVNLKHAIISLRDGLIEHQNREEAVLQPLVGDPLINSIKSEHRNILEILTDLDWILLNVGPLGVLYNSFFIKHKIDALCQILNTNCARENSVLELLQRLPVTQN